MSILDTELYFTSLSAILKFLLTFLLYATPIDFILSTTSLITSSAWDLVSPIFKTVTCGCFSSLYGLHYKAEIEGQLRFLLILPKLCSVAQNSRTPNRGKSFYWGRGWNNSKQVLVMTKILLWYVFSGSPLPESSYSLHWYQTLEFSNFPTWILLFVSLMVI